MGDGRDSEEWRQWRVTPEFSAVALGIRFGIGPRGPEGERKFYKQSICFIDGSGV